MNKKNEKSVFVSIIVPVYNEESNIKFLIESLLNLNYPKHKYEIIIVDNNSKDKTVEIIKEFQQVRCLFEKKQSSCISRNKGIREAKGNILAFIDGDCIPDKDWLRNAVIHILNRDVDIVAGQIVPSINFPSKLIEIYQSVIVREERRKNSKQQKICAGGNMIVKKKIFKKIGYFEEKLISGGDSEWTRRATLHRFKLRYYENVKVYHPLESFLSLFRRAVKIGYGIAQIRYSLHKPLSLPALGDNRSKNIVRRILEIYYNSIRVVWNNYKQDRFGRKELLILSPLSILLKSALFYGVAKGFLFSKWKKS